MKAQEKPKIIEVTLGLFAQLPSWGLLLHKMGSKVQIFFTSSQAQGLLLYKIDLKAQIFSTSRNELKVSNTHDSSYKEIKVHNLYLCMVKYMRKIL